MSSLFEATDLLERIPIVDAEVYYLSHLELGRDDEAILGQMIAEVPWRQESILVG